MGFNYNPTKLYNPLPLGWRCDGSWQFDLGCIPGLPCATLGMEESKTGNELSDGERGKISKNERKSRTLINEHTHRHTHTHTHTTKQIKKERKKKIKIKKKKILMRDAITFNITIIYQKFKQK
jgi:hypothetical protein